MIDLSGEYSQCVNPCAHFTPRTCLRASLRLLILLWLIILPAWSFDDEDYPRTINFQNIMHNQDIALGEVEAILQDHDGFMWFGGRNGLLRYDGADFLNVTIATAEGQQAENTHVNQTIDLFEDSRKQLWVATRSGLYLYNSAREILVPVEDSQTHQRPFANNIVSSIAELPSGEILLASWNGLYVYSPTTGQFQWVDLAGQPLADTANRAIYDLAVDHTHNRIWLAAATGLIRFDWQNKHSQHYLPDKNNPDSVSNNAIKTIALDAQGDVWLGADNGLYRFNSSTEAFTRYTHAAENPRSLSDNMVRHIMVGKNGWLWVGCQGGLNLYNRSGNNFIRFEHEDGQPNSLSSSITRRVYEDRNGDIWVGTYPSGVNFYDRSSDAIRVLKPHGDINKGLLSKTVEAITEDQQGQLWVGAGGVTRYNPAEDSYVHYRNTEPNPGIKTLEPINGFSDKNGRIWFGSWLNSFFVFNPELNRFEQMPFDLQLAGAKLQTSDKLPDNSVWSIYQDRANTFWLGTHNAGLVQFDPSTRRYKIFAPIAGDNNSLSNAVVWTSREDSKGRFWVGTAKGLNLMDRRSGSFKRYEANGKLRHQLMNDSVLVIFEDSQGRLWFGTDAGLHLYREATDDFEVFGSAEGFVDSGIRSITEDPKGNLWLGTNNGIVLFNPSSHAVQNYVRHNGENIGGTSTGASITTSKGIVAIGSKNGLVLIDSNKMRINKQPVPIVFTELRIFTEKVAIGDAQGILPQALNHTAEIRLDYRKNMLSLHFAALNFHNPDKNRYAYKLEGFDNDWREVGNQRSALYTNLDPGTYIFKVRAANNDGVWNEQGRSMRIVQLAPPWRTLWAYAFYVCVLIAVIAALVRAQLNKRRHLEEQSRLLELKVAERTAQLKQKNSAIAAMLSNMRQGLFTLEPDGRIHPEYSRHLEDIFAEQQLAGKDGFQLLFSHSSLPADTLSQLHSALQSMVGEDETNYECNVHLLLSEYEVNINGVHKFLSLDWNPIIEQATVAKMMVSVRDITALRQMEQAANAQKRELDIVAELIKVPADKYRHFYTSCCHFIAQNRSALLKATVRDDAVLALVFRNLHTIKGNARTFAFTFLTDRVHNAESYCTELTNCSTAPWNSARLLADLDLLEITLNEYELVFTQVLGRSDKTQAAEPGLRINPHLLHTIRAQLKSLTPTTLPPMHQQAVQQLQQLVAAASGASFTQLLADIINSLAPMAAQLAKPTPHVHCDADNIVIDESAHELVQNVFTHLLCNSLDHGIENPALRRALGKPAAGTIFIQATVQADYLSIRLRDDGQGLDLAKLYEKALQLGVIRAGDSLTYQTIADLIFQSGVSSKDELSDISGRGVGMAAVQQFLQQAGGDIHIKLDRNGIVNLADAEKIPFEFIINLPPELWFKID